MAPERARVTVLAEEVRLPFSKSTAVRYAEKVLSAVKSRSGRICILFAGNAKIRALNKRYRRKDKNTDVLAFETGDIAISVDAAEKNSRRFGSTAADELKLYVIHGILHLSGYDDTSSFERRRMRRMEEKLLKKTIKPVRADGAARGRFRTG